MVSTAVGEIAEVLPGQFIYFLDPRADSIMGRLELGVADTVTGARPDSWLGNHFIWARGGGEESERLYPW